MADLDALFQPFTVKNVIFRNRVMSTSHAPAYADEGRPKQRYQLYHLEKARGGIGLTMFGGSASVSPDSPAALWSQIDVGDDDVIPYFQEFAERIHGEGARLMCQLTHMGRRTRWDAENWFPTVSSSPVREPAHRSFPKEMEDWDIRRVTEDYGQAARRCVEGGLDGCELLATGHLIDQFWSPGINQRGDEYGGSLENRLRFPLGVLAEMRKQIGDDFILGVRLSADELWDDGLSPEEGMAIVDALVASGLVDYLNVNCGNVTTDRALSTMIPGMAFPPAPYLYMPSAIKQKYPEMAVFHGGRVSDVNTAARAVAEGHMDMVAMTRPHIADPHIVNKMREGRVDDIRQCVGASYCLDRIYVGGEALCIQNPATGREASMPQVITRRVFSKRKIVVVGGGVAGLEAARVSASVGHEVVLFEASERTGGQVNIAAKAGWREALSGIPRWLHLQAAKLGVDIRTGSPATKDRVLAEVPDVVVMATGGTPNLSVVENGPELAVSTWDILNGAVEPGETVLVYDEQANDAGPGTAAFLAKRGIKVELITSDRMIARELGASNFPTYLRDLYANDVILTPDTKMEEIYREGNRLVAVLKNEFSDQEEERLCDQVVIEYGTLPVLDLYNELKPLSRNLGELDLRAVADGRNGEVTRNDDGTFTLFRVGDAWASRNVHAAIYDALRICKEL